jgi:hypothetical protein
MSQDRAPATETSPTTDDDIINLNGGLFEEARLSAHSMPLIDVSRRPVPAQQRTRGAQRISWTLVASATACLALGLSAGGEVDGEPPEPAAAVIVPVTFVSADSTLACEPEATAEPEPSIPAPATAPSAAQRSAEMKRPQLVRGAAEPPQVMRISLPASPPQRSPLAAFAAPVHELSRAAAAIAVAAAAHGAGQCLDPGDTRTSIGVRVTFAPSGRVEGATVTGGPYVGTAARGCIVRMLRAAQVAPFEGSPVSVSTSIRLR